MKPKRPASPSPSPESEASYRDLFATIANGIVFHAADGRILSANPAAERILGLTLDQMQGRSSIDPWWRVIHEDGSPFPGGSHPSMVALGTGRPTEDMTMGVFRAAGAPPVWISANGVPLFRPGEAEPHQAFVAFRDITAWKASEDARRKAQAILGSALESMTDAIFISDLEGRFLEFNEAFASFYRFGSKQECARTFGQYPDLLEAFLPGGERVPLDQWAVPRALRGERESGFEVTVRRRDTGESWQASFSFGPILDQAGQIAGAVVVGRDITRWKLLEQQKHQAMFQHSPLGICLTDPDGLLQEVNPAFAAMVGFESPDLLGSPASRFNHPDDQPCFRDRLQALARGGLDEVQAECRWVRRDGAVIWVNTTVRPVRGGSGKIRFLFAMVEDISEKRRIREALEASEAKYSTLFRILPTGVALVDEAGRIMECNPAAGRILGITREDCLARTRDAPSWQILRADGSPCPPEEYVTRRTLEAGQPVENVEQGMRRPDGTTTWHLASAAPIGVPGFGAALVAQDITARREVEAALEELNRVLEERVRATVADLRRRDQMLVTQNRQAAMGEMIGNIAHQWRQPLNTLSMLLINLGDAHSYGELTGEKLKRSLKKGDLVIQKMSSTINDFRNFFRPDKERVGFSALKQILGAVAIVEASFAAEGIEIGLEAPEDVTLTGFPNEFSQVLLNLLSNARQAIQDGQRRPGRVRLHLQREAGFGVLTMRDTGGGVPEDLLERIFEPYFSTRATGTGIGLFMSRQIIEQNMAGRITARNLEGVTEFCLRVPAQEERP